MLSIGFANKLCTSSVTYRLKVIIGQSKIADAISVSNQYHTLGVTHNLEAIFQQSRVVN